MYRFVYECVFIPRNGIIGFIGLFVFLLLSFESSVYILDSNLLLNMWYFLPVFLFFSECLLQVNFFFLILMKSNYVFLFYGSYFLISVKQLLPNARSQRLSRVFFSEFYSFMFYISDQKSILSLIFARRLLRTRYFAYECYFVLISCWKHLFFLHLIAFVPFSIFTKKTTSGVLLVLIWLVFFT